MTKKGATEGGNPKPSKSVRQKQRRKKKKEQQEKEEKVQNIDQHDDDPENKLPKPQLAKKKKPLKKTDDQYESHSEEDYSDTQQERKNEYRKGGYHPVTEGELYNNRYRVVKKLGWGYFSTVWLCWDHDELNFKAIKIQKSAQHYREAAFDEITLLSQIRDGDPDNAKCCCRLTDHFEHKGPNGLHVVMVFEVLGENLLELIMRYDYKGIPIPVVKNITRQVLIALDYLHRELQIIHTDLKPENVVVAMPQKQVQKAMESYSPPDDRHKQLTLAERDPTTLTKAQKKRLRKKLKLQQKDGAADGKDDNDEDDEDAEEAPNGAVGGSNGDVKVTPKKAVESPRSPKADAATKEAPAEVKAEAEPSHRPAGGPLKEGKERKDAKVGRDAKDAKAGKDRKEAKEAKAGDAASKPPLDDESLEEALKRYNHVKLVDFGNACWTHKHFTEDIQTRQYRSPEVIVRNSYDTSADVWSCACLVFELLTGDFLFDPQESEYIDRDEDHLALIVELLQTQPQVPTCLYAKGANEYVNSQGYLRHINHLKFWDLKSVLHEKYKLRKDKAAEVADFMLPLLAIDPAKRATARQALKHPWLQVVPTDWEPYTAEEPAAEGAPAAAGYHSDEDWEEDEESEDGGAEFGDLELPPGMTLEMYRYYVEHQMQLLHTAEEKARRQAATDLADGDVVENDSEGPGSPVSGSPLSEGAEAAVAKQVQALSLEDPQAKSQEPPGSPQSPAGAEPVENGSGPERSPGPEPEPAAERAAPAAPATPEAAAV